MIERKILVLMSALLLGSPALAVDWNSLSSEQRTLLRGYESGWEALGEEQQQRLSTGSERWLKLDADQRDSMLQRYQRWNGLPADQQKRLLERLETFRTLSPGSSVEFGIDSSGFAKCHRSRKNGCASVSGP